MNKQITIDDVEHIEEAAREFANHIDHRRVFAFYGEMGVGKTTFVKALCHVLGVEDVVNSPTFAIVNEYTIAKAPAAMPHVRTIYHFDFYRIKKIEEVYDMGYEDYFYSGALCFIEWPELIEELLPEDAVRVSLTKDADGRRTMNFNCN